MTAERNKMFRQGKELRCIVCWKPITRKLATCSKPCSLKKFYIVKELKAGNIDKALEMHAREVRKVGKEVLMNVITKDNGVDIL